MSNKQANPPSKALDTCNRSTFTLTFAIEVIVPGLDTSMIEECKEGWLELGPCLKSLKLQYQLYYGQIFILDIAIFEQVAKVLCGTEGCLVRIWRFLERRWLTFSINHAFPVRVADLRDFEATVNVSSASGTSAKLCQDVFFPPLHFRQRRYFGHVIEGEVLEVPIYKWVQDWIWNLVVNYIPPSPFDGCFDIPYPVKDIRHQDSILYKIQEQILNQSTKIIEQHIENIVPVPPSGGKDKAAKKAPEKKLFAISLSGDAILAGTGRLIPFETFGEPPSDIGEVITYLGSANLPASDDDPIVFINVGHLFNAPLEELKKLHITHLYTRWTLGDEVHDSEKIAIESLSEDGLDFKDSHAFPFSPSGATIVTAIFLEDPYSIELRGIRELPDTSKTNAKLFGYDKQDRDFGMARIPPAFLDNEKADFIIAITKINCRVLAKGLNGYINGEYSLFPPRSQVKPHSRQAFCTNDINMIHDVEPKQVVSSCLILTAHMTLEVSMGIAGCKPPKMHTCFSRLFCIIKDSVSIVAIGLTIKKINDELSVSDNKSLLTGFALDTGDEVVLFVEGPRDGSILKIWEMTEEFYPKIKPVFSTSARFSSRIYPEFQEAVKPFLVLKFNAPLSLILACPSVYARPALPLPARNAVLKLGRLVQHRYKVLPPRCRLPTVDELRSLRLELCIPPRPIVLPRGPGAPADDNTAVSKNNPPTKINWSNN